VQYQLQKIITQNINIDEDVKLFYLEILGLKLQNFTKTMNIIKINEQAIFEVRHEFRYLTLKLHFKSELKVYHKNILMKKLTDFKIEKVM